MRVGFQCHRYDKGDFINGSIVAWIDYLAEHVEEVRVITLDPPKSLPTRGNVYLHGFHKGRSKVHTTLNFFKNALTLAPKVDCFFIWQGGHYPGLLKPISLLTGKPIFQWKAHIFTKSYQKLYSRWCSKATFTTSMSSYNGGGLVVITGQAIDTKHFQPKEVDKEWDFLSVGRMNVRKGFHVLIKGLAKAKGRYSLAIAGPCLTDLDREYEGLLRELARELKVDVRFIGPVKRTEMPWVMSKARWFAHAAIAAVDRATLEAGACGVPVISSQRCVVEACEKADLEIVVEVDRTPEAFAEKMDKCMGVEGLDYAMLSLDFRGLVNRDHDAGKTWQKIVPIMKIFSKGGKVKV